MGRLIERVVEDALHRVQAALTTLNALPMFDGHEDITFASLPSGPLVGEGKFCNDCRKCGEGAGVGTGTVIYYDGTAWRRVCDDASAAT